MDWAGYGAGMSFCLFLPGFWIVLWVSKWTSKCLNLTSIVLLSALIMFVCFLLFQVCNKDKFNIMKERENSMLLVKVKSGSWEWMSQRPLL